MDPAELKTLRDALKAHKIPERDWPAYEAMAERGIPFDLVEGRELPGDDDLWFAPAEPVLKGWVTLGEGDDAQHVYIDDHGDVHPSGPGRPATGNVHGGGPRGGGGEGAEGETSGGAGENRQPASMTDERAKEIESALGKPISQHHYHALEAAARRLGTLGEFGAAGGTGFSVLNASGEIVGQIHFRNLYGTPIISVSYDGERGNPGDTIKAIADTVAVAREAGTNVRVTDFSGADLSPAIRSAMLDMGFDAMTSGLSNGLPLYLQGRTSALDLARYESGRDWLLNGDGSDSVLVFDPARKASVDAFDAYRQSGPAPLLPDPEVGGLDSTALTAKLRPMDTRLAQNQARIEANTKEYAQTTAGTAEGRARLRELHADTTALMKEQVEIQHERFVTIKEALETSGGTQFDATMHLASPEAQRIRMKGRIRSGMGFLSNTFSNYHAENRPNGSLPVEFHDTDFTGQNKTGREASYCAGNRIFLQSTASESVAVHELGHAIEHGNPAIQAACQEFLAKRTKGEKAQKLSALTGSKAYDDSEVAKPDKFLHPYSGKIYPSGSTEILSMGLQRMKEDPHEFQKQDPDYFNFTLDVMRGTYVLGGKPKRGGRKR